MMHGEAKAEAVLALAEREGLDLARCTAYSDSSNDLPMLSLTGTAVAVNPDTELRSVARARGWAIRDFRTGRKAAKIGVPTVAAAALSGGLVGGALALPEAQQVPLVSAASCGSHRGQEPSRAGAEPLLPLVREPPAPVRTAPRGARLMSVLGRPPAPARHGQPKTLLRWSSSW